MCGQKRDQMAHEKGVKKVMRWRMWAKVGENRWQRHTRRAQVENQAGRGALRCHIFRCNKSESALLGQRKHEHLGYCTWNLQNGFSDGNGAMMSAIRTCVISRCARRRARSRADGVKRHESSVRSRRLK